MKIELDRLKESVKNNISLADVIRDLNLSKNGATYPKLNRLIKENNIDISHFLPNKSHLIRKYPRDFKKCPICNTQFLEKIGSPRERTVCSKACANTYFKSGKNNPNWKEDDELSNHSVKYRKKFSDLEFICARCGYNEFKCSVQIHHIDENRKNNNKENLIPLCANCHSALHSNKWSLNDIIMVYEANIS